MQATIGSVCLIATLAFSAGCQDGQQTVKTAPGALPSMALDKPGVDPKLNSSTYFAHGHLLERQGAYEKAIANYKEAIKLQPDSIVAMNRMGVTYNKMGKHAEASLQFAEAIARKPDASYLYNNLGFSLFLEGRYAESERACAKALALKPDFVRAKMNQALALGKLNRFDEAYTLFTTICTPSDALFNVGIMLTEASRYAQAAQYLEASLAANPDNAAARTQLNEVARLAAMEGRENADASRVAGATTTATPNTVTLTSFATPAGIDASDASVATVAAQEITPTNTTSPTPATIEPTTPTAAPAHIEPTTPTPAPAAEIPAPTPTPTPANIEPTTPTQTQTPPPQPTPTEVPAQVAPTTPTPTPTETPASSGVLEVPAKDVPKSE